MGTLLITDMILKGCYQYIYLIIISTLTLFSGRFCGSGRVTELIVSTGSRMLITLQVSPKQQGHRGFTAHYEGL